MYMRILVFASGAVCFALDKCWALENSNVLIQSFVMPRPVLRFSQTDLKPCNVPPCIKHYERLIHGFVNAHPALSIHSSTVSTWLRVVLPLLLVFLTNRISDVFFLSDHTLSDCGVTRTRIQLTHCLTPCTEVIIIGIIIITRVP